MAKIPNQNNILQIIKDAVGVIETVAKGLDEADKLSKKEAGFKALHNIVGQVNSIYVTVTSTKINAKKFKSGFANIAETIDCIVEGVEKIEKTLDKSKDKFEKVNNRLEKLIPVIEKLNKTFSTYTDLITAKGFKVNVVQVTGKWLQIIIATNMFFVGIMYIIAVTLMLWPLSYALKLVPKILKPYQQVLEAVSELFGTINSIKTSPMLIFKLVGISAIMMALGTAMFIVAASTTLIMVGTTLAGGPALMFLQLRIANLLIAAVGILFNTISQVKSGLWLLIKIRAIRRIMGKVSHMFTRIVLTVAMMGAMLKFAGGFRRILITILESRLIIHELRSLMKGISLLGLMSILFIVMYPVAKLGIKLLTSFFRYFNILMRRMRPRRTAINAKKMTMILGHFILMGLMLIALGILSVGIIRLAPMILLFFGAIVLIVLIIKLIAKVLRKMNLAATYVMFMKLTGVLLLITAIATLLMISALMAALITSHILELLALFGMIILVGLAIALIGWVLQPLLPIIEIAALVILTLVATVVIIVGAIMLIALMLWVIAKIELDENAIIENVDRIIGIVFHIIGRLFNRGKDPEKSDSPYGGIVGAIKGWFGMLGDIITLFIGCWMLILTVVAVGLILIIAGMLWLLSKIKIDEGKILETVDTIFNTIDSIIDRLFAPRKDTIHKSNRGTLLTIVGWIDEGIAKVIEAALTVAYLAMAMMSVMMVLAIAIMLRLLQALNLDEQKILDNVNKVFNVVDSIIDRIFAPRKDEQNKSSRGILITIVSWLDEGLAKIIEAALSVVYLALIMLSVAMVLAIASMLRLLQELDLDSDTIVDKVNAVFDACDKIIERVMSPRSEDGEGSSRGILLTIVGWVFGEGLVKVFEAALTIIYVFLIMIAVTMVLGIALLLKQLQDVDLQESVILEKVDTIFNTADRIMARVFAPAEEKTKRGGGWLSTLIGFFSPQLASVIDAIMMILNLALIFMAISIVGGIAEELKKVQDLNVEGGALIRKVDGMFDTCQHIVNKVINNNITIPKKKKSGLAKLTSFFNPIPDEISDMMDSMGTLNMVYSAIGVVANIAQQLERVYKACKDIDLVAARDMVNRVLDTAEDVAMRVFGNESKFKLPDPKEDKDGEIMNALGDFWLRSAYKQQKEYEKMQEAMRRLQVLQMVCSAIGILDNIQRGIDSMMKLDFSNWSGAKQRVKEIIDAAADISASIFGADVNLTLPDPMQDPKYAEMVQINDAIRGWLGSNWADSDADMAVKGKAAAMKLAEERIKVLGFIGSAVGVLVTIMDNIGKIDKMQLPERATLVTKVQQAIAIADDIAMAVYNTNLGFGGGTSGQENVNRHMEAKLKFLSDSTKTITDIAKQLEELSKLKSVSGKMDMHIQDNIDSVISSILNIQEQSIDYANVNKKLDLMDKLAGVLNKMPKFNDKDVKNSKSISDNWIKLLDKFDKMNLQKLNLGESMIRHFALVTDKLKGDFNSLAKALNEDVAPMLESLRVTMDEAVKTQKAIIDELSKPIDINLGNGGGGGAGGLGGGINPPGDPTNPGTPPGGDVDPPAGQVEAVRKTNTQVSNKFNTNTTEIGSGKYQLTVTVHNAIKQ